jgi:hypothetical protein
MSGRLTTRQTTLFLCHRTNGDKEGAGKSPAKFKLVIMYPTQMHTQEGLFFNQTSMM